LLAAKRVTRRSSLGIFDTQRQAANALLIKEGRP
jgi:hypothetical protein